MTLAPSPAEPLVHGEAIVYRLFDAGHAVSLDRAIDLLASLEVVVVVLIAVEIALALFRH